MTLLSSTRRALAVGAVGGLVVGVVLTLLLVSAIWPEEQEQDTAQVGVAVPTVPPVPTTTDLTGTGAEPSSTPGSPSESPTTSEPSDATDDATDDASDDEGDDDDDHEQPDSAPRLANAAPAGEGKLPDTKPVTCPAATVTVSDAAGLEQALQSAGPGDSIKLSDGTYAGNFTITASGTQQRPAYLCGGSGAVLDGGDIDGDYALHLDHASYWRLVGFTVSGGQKGVVADTTVGSVIQGLTVRGTGDEAIHLRTNSTDNVVQGNTISDTGNRRDKYGEGVYVGSAVSNWCTYTDCEADRSDRNVVKGNTISDTTAEAVDIKEGTTGGVVSGNTFDGSSLADDADSWVDVKGNNYLIEGNTGRHSPEDGFQTHEILDGWGDLNVFTRNSADLGSDGYGIAVRPAESNVVRCDNTVADAAGLSNIPCT